jgi:hypothetical protein
MTPTIRVDEDVYERLQREAKPFVDTPNSVLRRLLGLESGESGAEAAGRGNSAGGERGELASLVEAGLLGVGEQLVWKRRHTTHSATVTRGGCLQLSDGRVFSSPSGAARALSGYEVNGWRNWGRPQDGVRLSSLRDRLS